MAPTKDKTMAKTTRKSISLETKQEIIRLYDRKVSNSEICKKFDLKSSTVSTICNPAGRRAVKKALEEQVNMKATKLNQDLKPPVIHDVETILWKYLQFNLDRKIYLLKSAICTKAIEIFNFLMDEKNGLYTPNGHRIKKGVPTPIEKQEEAMGPAYQLPEEMDFEGFDSNENPINTGQNEAEPSASSSNVMDWDINEAAPLQSSSTSMKKITFQASAGWYHRCVRKNWGYKYHVKHGEADSADIEAAKKFVPKITQFILDHFDGPEFVYNVDECALYYKKLLDCCVDTNDKKKQMKGFKQNTTRVTLLVGGNAAGEKLKPFVIGSSQMPHALRGINRDTMQCYYQSSKKSWMTGDLMWKWFMDCFIKEMETRHGDDFMVLLTLDNCTAHPPEMADYDPRVIICFLPKNTTALIQPMDQGIIRNFKLKMHSKIYRDLIKHIDTTPIVEDGENPMVQFYRNLNIYDCIKYAGEAWFDEVKDSTMVNCWHNFFDQEKLKGLPQYQKLIRKEKKKNSENITGDMDDTHNEDQDVEEESLVILNDLVRDISISTLGTTSAGELEGLLTFEQAEMGVLDIAKDFLFEKETLSTPLEDESSEVVKTKDLKDLLVSFNDLEIQLRDVFEFDDKTLDESLEKLNLAKNPIRDILNEKYEHFSQSKMTKYYQPKHKSARSEAKRLSSQFSSI